VSIFQAWFANGNMRFWFRALRARLRDERAELGEIRRHLRSGDLVCDIGANKGGFVYWLSRWVGDGRVVAFEPQPELAERLRHLCQVAGLANVTVEAKAVHLQSGEQQLHVPVGHQPGASLVRHDVGADEFVTFTVPVVALDDYFAGNEKIALLKIDVEGAEMGLLKGAERILRQQAPLLVLECENRHQAPGTIGDVFAYLRSFGYEGSFVWRKRLIPLYKFDVAVHQREDGPWFWKSQDYCHNFVFRKAANGAGAASAHSSDDRSKPSFEQI
jgi:FkbM family methyltransferase